MGRPKKIKETITEASKPVDPIIEVVENQGVNQKVITKELVESNKLTVEQLLKLMHYSEKDYSEESNVIKIQRPILNSNFKCWKSVISGSVFSYMEINKNDNTVKIWDLTDKVPPSRLIKDSLVLP